MKAPRIQKADKAAMCRCLPLCILLSLFLPALAHATAQVPDELIHKGKIYALYTTPLESHPARKKLKMSTTACWRGYQARWEIVDDELRLIGLRECHERTRIPIARVLPGKKLPLTATWFTGTLRVPQGKMIFRPHLGFRREFEKDMLIWIEAGKVVRARIVDNRPGSKTKASKPPSPAALDKGLSQCRASLLECGKLDGAPATIDMHLSLEANGNPDRQNTRVLGEVGREVAGCVRSVLFYCSHFPASDGAVVVRHTIKLR